MAMGRLFVAFLDAEVGDHPCEVAGEVHKILNRCGVRLGAHSAPDGEEAHNLLWTREHIAPLLAYAEEDPTWQAVVGSEHCYALCTHQFWLCHTLRVDMLVLRFVNTTAGNQAPADCCSLQRIVIQCLRVRMHAGWDWLPCRGTLWRAPIAF